MAAWLVRGEFSTVSKFLITPINALKLSCYTCVQGGNAGLCCDVLCCKGMLKVSCVTNLWYWQQDGCA